MGSLVLNFITSLKIGSPEFGREFFARLWTSHYGLVPTHMGNCEPIRTVVKGPDDAIKFWGDSVLWKRSGKPKMGGSVWSPFKNDLWWIHISVKDASLLDDLFAQFCDLVAFLDVYIASYHVVPDSDEGMVIGSREYALASGFPPIALEKGIPDLAWCTAISERLSEEISLPSSLPPQGSMRSIDVHTFLTLTSSPQDELDRKAEVDAARTSLKDWIGPQHFWPYKSEQDAADQLPARGESEMS
jgi:hypothetical protein